MPSPKELLFEDDVVEGLVAAGYRLLEASGFDLELGLNPDVLVEFVRVSQPHRWDAFCKRNTADPELALAKVVSADVRSRGYVAVLRGEVKTQGVRFKIGYLPPALTADGGLAAKVSANIFGVSRQQRFEPGSGETLDVVTSLNGVPFSTLELKSPLNGQTVKNAVNQYRRDRNYPKNRMLHGAVVHFAVDTARVKMTTKLAGSDTYFLPFNRGTNPGELSSGAGNPPAQLGAEYATAYLWEDVLAPATVLDIFRNYLTVLFNDGERATIFPRFHQLDAARRSVDAVLADGVGDSYLFQHSAGSGKSKTISWTADRMSRLHDAAGTKLFDKVIVITDRRVLDEQLRSDVLAAQGTDGVVVTVEEGKGSKSQQLLAALRSGARIVTVTLPSFPHLLKKMSDDDEFSGKRYAIFADEAHGSQTGDSARALKQALGEGIGVDAADEDLFDPTSAAATVMASRGKQPNLSWFAYTATPKPRTVELFGTSNDAGEKRPFHLYTMRQAIEEEFILDVLKNFTPYPTFFTVGTKDPDFEDEEQEASKVSSAVRKVLTRNPDNISQKAQIIVEHVRTRTMRQLGGKAQAMIVTDSRQSAVRFKQAIDAHIVREGYSDLKALVAFSGEVSDDDGDIHTETSMNGFPESQTKKRFLGEHPHEPGEYQVLIVAEKFQTGFDDPLLTTMFVAKKLSGLHAVQTLSRLNRAYSNGPVRKTDVYVIDFVNQPEAIQEAFQPFYEGRLVNETNPDRLYPIHRDIESTGLLRDDEIRSLTDAWFASDSTDPKAMKQIMAGMNVLKERFDSADEETQQTFRDRGDEFVRVYGFLSHIMTWVDEELERLYVYMQAALKITTPDASPGVDLSDELFIKQIAHRADDPTAIGLEAGNIEVVDSFSERGDRPIGQGELHLEEVRTIIERINAKHHTNFSDLEVLEGSKAVTMVADSDGLAELVADNDIDDVVDTEWKRLLLNVLPSLEDHSNEFWNVIRENPAILEEFGKHLVRAACETLE